MNIKIRLQQMLQILEDAERNGALSDIERDILLADLREAYAELKFGQTENGERKTENGERKTENDIVEHNVVVEEETLSTLNSQLSTEEDDEPEVEVELVFNEEDNDEEVEEESEKIEEVVESPSTLNSPLSTPAVEPAVEKEELSTLNSPLSTPKRSALLSLYEDEPTPILGEQFHEAPSVADTIACPKGIAESAPVASLREAIGVADRFMLIGELFDGDAEAYDKAISVLEAQPSLEDAMIYIAENYTWSPNATATKFVMELLNRKYN